MGRGVASGARRRKRRWRRGRSAGAARQYWDMHCEQLSLHMPASTLPRGGQVGAPDPLEPVWQRGGQVGAPDPLEPVWQRGGQVGAPDPLEPVWQRGGMHSLPSPPYEDYLRVVPAAPRAPRSALSPSLMPHLSRPRGWVLEASDYGAAAGYGDEDGAVAAAGYGDEDGAVAAAGYGDEDGAVAAAGYGDEDGAVAAAGYGDEDGAVAAAGYGDEDGAVAAAGYGDEDGAVAAAPAAPWSSRSALHTRQPSLLHLGYPIRVTRDAQSSVLTNLSQSKELSEQKILQTDVLDALERPARVEVEARVAGVEARVAGVEARVAGVEARVAGVEARVAGVEARVAGVEARVAGVEKEVASMTASAPKRKDKRGRTSSGKACIGQLALQGPAHIHSGASPCSQFMQNSENAFPAHGSCACNSDACNYAVCAACTNTSTSPGALTHDKTKGRLAINAARRVCINAARAALARSSDKAVGILFESVRCAAFFSLGAIS